MLKNIDLQFFFLGFHIETEIIVFWILQKLNLLFKRALMLHINLFDFCISSDVITVPLG